LEEETQKAYILQKDYIEKKNYLKNEETEIENLKTTLENEIKKLKTNKTEEFLTDLKKKEKIIEELFMKAEEISYQFINFNNIINNNNNNKKNNNNNIYSLNNITNNINNNNNENNNNNTLLSSSLSSSSLLTMNEEKNVNLKTLENLKKNLIETRIETEKDFIQETTKDIAVPLEPGVPIEEGTSLVILEKGFY
jgi:hypothetical protein